MANFCPKCGKEVNSDDRFCKNCGANLASSVESPKRELTPEQPPAFIQPVTPSSKPGPRWTYTLTNILGVLIGLGIIFLILYSLGCAMGMFPNTQDRMCQSIHQAFKSGGTSDGGGSSGGTSGGGGSQVSIGCQHCSPGYCWTGTACCPSYAQYYCNGSCYRSSGEAYSAGCHQSSWTRWCCQ